MKTYYYKYFPHFFTFSLTLLYCRMTDLITSRSLLSTACLHLPSPTHGYTHLLSRFRPTAINTCTFLNTCSLYSLHAFLSFVFLLNFSSPSSCRSWFFYQGSRIQVQWSVTSAPQLQVLVIQSVEGYDLYEQGDDTFYDYLVPLDEVSSGYNRSFSINIVECMFFSFVSFPFLSFHFLSFHFISFNLI